MTTNLMNRLSEIADKSVNKYLVFIEFNEDVLGTQPKTKELMRKFVETKLNREAREAEKKGLVPPSDERRLELLNRHLERMFGAASVDETIDDEVEQAHTTFFHDDEGPYIGNYQMKACIRDMLTTLGISVAKRGSKQTFQHQMGVRSCDEHGNIYPGEKGLRLHFYRNGQVVDKVDDWIEKTAHVMTAQGPRSIIKRHDRVLNATLRFVITTQANAPKNRSTALIKDDEVLRIMIGAQNNGLGCSRSQGHGTFEVINLERITNIPWLQGGKAPDGNVDGVAQAAK
jgi:hypothetical protein